LGRHIGYLPQDMELFSGTVRENIGRFDTNATDDEVIAAATAAHAHELVMSLPRGYHTELGAFGTHLSGGQRQRIALARALFRNPALVVLDEANANLDRAGDVALAQAIDGMRARGQAIVFVSHRVQAIQQADTLLYIERGQQKAFGPRDQVLAAINGQGQPTAAQEKPQPTPEPPPSRAQAPAAGGDRS
jgi:ABC-type protease/lipase transport system fused ATPase/permease subunit